MNGIVVILLIGYTHLLYNYDLASTKETWVGSGYAAHYFNQFIFGSNKLDDGIGSMSSYTVYKSHSAFDLHFEYEILQDNSEEITHTVGHKGGLGIWLNSEASYFYDKASKKYSLFGSNYNLHGYFFFIPIHNNAKESDNLKLYYGFREKGSQIPMENLLEQSTTFNCDLKMSNKKIIFYVKKMDNKLEIFISDDNEKMNLCAPITDFNISNFKLFLSYASNKNQYLQINLKHMSFNTDKENNEIVYFDKSEKDNYIPKLFINLETEKLLNNNDENDSNYNKTDFSLGDFFSKQRDIIKNLKYSEKIINVNKYEMDYVIDLLRNLNNTNLDFFEKFISTTKDWISNVNQQFKLIHTDSKDIIKEIETININDALEHSDNIIIKIKEKLGFINTKIDKFKSTTEKINKNLNFVKNINEQKENIPELIKKITDIEKHENFKGVETAGYMLIGVLGVIVGIALSFIIFNINKLFTNESFR